MVAILTNDFPSLESIQLLNARDFGEGINARRVLPSVNRPMIGPFVLLDHIGPKVFAAGEGFDMRPHPHIGLAAVTYLMDGELIHRDSLGSVQTIRPGEVNWMTAGSGVVHSERTTGRLRLSGSDFLGVQAWIALPSRYEEVDAGFAHHDIYDIPKLYADGVEFTLIAGASDGLVSPVKTYSDLIYAEIVLTSGARYQVRPDHVERAIYVVAGEVEVMGQAGTFGEGQLIVLKPGADIVLRAPAFHAARMMLLAGEPFLEPRHLYWNFVSSSAELIEQAKADWRQRRFPEIPDEDEFALQPENWQEDAR
jgi:redox-sensitive bicupin YhaK (pirin superfamily)